MIGEPYAELATVHEALAEALVARRDRWFESWEHLLVRNPELGVTALRFECDKACRHLDNEITRLEGKRDALNAIIRGLEAR